MPNKNETPKPEYLDGIIPAGTYIDMKMSVKYTENSKDVYSTTIRVDFSGCTLRTALTWAAGDRRISLQRGLRAIETEQQFAAVLTAKDEKGELIPIHIHATEAGKKPKTPKTPEQIMEETKAALAGMSAEQKAQLLALLQTQE